MKERLLTELEAKKQAAPALRQFETEFEMPEYENFPSDKGLEEMPSSFDEDVFTLESQRENLLEDSEEAKMKSVIDQDATIGQDGNKMNC